MLNPKAMYTAAGLLGLVALGSLAVDYVDAGPLPQQDQAVLDRCTQRPWPYLNCVGTEFNTRVRLIRSDHLPE